MTVFAIKHLHAQVRKTLHVTRDIPGMSDGKWLTQLFAVDFFDRTLFVTPNFALVCFQYIARELADVCISTISCSSTATFTKQFSSCSGFARHGMVFSKIVCHRPVSAHLTKRAITWSICPLRAGHPTSRRTAWKKALCQQVDTNSHTINEFYFYKASG